MSLFEWVGRFIDLLVSFVPRFGVIRSTHLGVKWPRGKKSVGLGPGIHWYWPLLTEMEIIVAARQTNQLPAQSLTLADGSDYSVRGVCVYSINDVVAAIGQKNWDVDQTVTDLSQAAITEIVMECDEDSIRNLKGINKQITERAQELLNQFGVAVSACRLVECVQSSTYRILGGGSYPIVTDDHSTEE